MWLINKLPSTTFLRPSPAIQTINYFDTKLLIEFYETNDISTIKTFVYNECVDGISF